MKPNKRLKTIFNLLQHFVCLIYSPAYATLVLCFIILKNIAETRDGWCGLWACTHTLPLVGVDSWCGSLVFTEAAGGRKIDKVVVSGGWEDHGEHPPPPPIFCMCHKFLMDGCEIVNYAYFWVHMNITHGETWFLQLIRWLNKITCEDIILLMHVQHMLVFWRKKHVKILFLLMYSICRLWWFVPIKC